MSGTSGHYSYPSPVKKRTKISHKQEKMRNSRYKSKNYKSQQFVPSSNEDEAVKSPMQTNLTMEVTGSLFYLVVRSPELSGENKHLVQIHLKQSGDLPVREGFDDRGKF